MSQNPINQNEETITKEEAAGLDKKIKILTLVVVAAAVALLLYVISQRVLIPTNNYKNGVSEKNAGNYAAAAEYFLNAGDYEDAAELYEECRQKANDLLAGKENAVAYTTDAVKWLSIDNGTLGFSKDTYEDALVLTPGEVILPDILDGQLVTAIKDKAFLNADTVTTVTLPECLTVLPDGCFYNCAALTEVKFGGKLTTIAQRAFINCTALETLTVPATVTEIGLRAFNNCYALKTLTIEGNIPELPSYVCAECYALTEITIPASVKTIGENAFIDCVSLETVRFGGTEAEWNAIAVAEGNEALTAANVIFEK